MKLKQKIISAVLSAVLLAGSVSVPNTPLGITASAASSTKLAAPTGVKATKTSNSVKLSWNAVKGAGGYCVYMYNASTKKYEKYKDVTTTSCTVKGLKASTTYKFKVATLKFTTQSSSKTLSKKTSSSATSVKLSWSAVKGAAGYRVYKYNSSTKKYVKYKDVLTTSCTVTGLKASTTYKFKVTPLKFTVQNTSGVISAKTSSSSKPADNEQTAVTSVTINGKQYDVATTTTLDLGKPVSLTDEDMENIGKLVNLTDLHLWNTGSGNIKPLANLKKLKKLFIAYIEISDITPLGKLTNLEELTLKYTYNISDVSALSGLTNLKLLDLEGNKITDISPLSSLTNLKLLSLNENPITDISPVTSLTNLTSLWIIGCKLNDFKPIGELKNLFDLEAAGCGMSRDDYNYLIEQLPNLMVLM